LSPTEQTYEQAQEPLDAIPVLDGWVRLVLTIVTLGLLAVFAVAVYLKPYEDDGVTPLRMETHRQLGLPPCTFKTMTGLPCPSCGMTTSFALLVRGRLLSSLRANCVGTLLAAFCLVLIPWNIGSIVLGRPLFIVSLERALMWSIIGFLALMLLRWAIVLTMLHWGWVS